MTTKTFYDPQIRRKAAPNNWSPQQREAVLVRIDLLGNLHIESSMGDAETVDLLDKAMEAIDGQRLPPN